MIYRIRGVPDSERLVVQPSVVVTVDPGGQLVELVACHLPNLLEHSVLGPVGVVYAFIETRSSLVAPQGVCPSADDVRESAVEQLKQLVPLCGVVFTCFVTLETDCIMEYVLKKEVSKFTARREIPMKITEVHIGTKQHESTVHLQIPHRVMKCLWDPFFPKIDKM